MDAWITALTILGMGVVTVVARGLLLMPKNEVPLPSWSKRALKFAPLAALVAVVVPEVLLTQGVLIGTLADARVIGAIAGIAWFVVRRGMLGTILVGMAVFLPLRIGMGW